MMRKHFHWVEGLVVAALLSAVTWMNTSAAAPDSFSGARAYDSKTTSPLPPTKASLSGDQKRIREGTEIEDRAGYFRQDGDGATFVTDDGFELGGLPNLNLERVVRTLKTADESKTIRWRVNGTITEFSGRNYLFITRAVYKSTTPPPAPTPLVVEPANGI